MLQKKAKGNVTKNLKTEVLQKFSKWKSYKRF